MGELATVPRAGSHTEISCLEIWPGTSGAHCQAQAPAGETTAIAQLRRPHYSCWHPSTRTPRKGARDLAICALTLDTGLRVSELCRLQQQDVDTEHGVLQVLVKGGQWEAAIFSAETGAHIERWKSYRKIADGQGFLFTHVRTGQGLTPEGLNTIVGDWGGTSGSSSCPHDLRRSMAVIGTLNGASERSLMEMGRWKSSTMIKRYTRTLTARAAAEIPAR